MGKARILIVEDEILVSKDLTRRLKILGYDVTATATSGDEAVRVAETVQPDLVLMDIKLEGEMDGIEAAERLQSPHGTPVIYLTAFADDETIQRAKTTAPFGYLIKPSSSRELHSAVEMALYKAETDRRLKANEQRLSRAHRIARLGDWDADLPTGRVTWSDSLYDVLGLDKESAEASFGSLLRVTHPDDRDDLRAIMENASPERPCVEHDFRILRQNGTERVLAAVVEHRFDDSGRPIGSIGTLQDITDRKRAQKELQKAHDELESRVAERTAALVVSNNNLREEIERRVTAQQALSSSEAQKRAILDAISSHIAYVDTNLTIQWLNDAALRWAGSTPDRAIGRAYHEFRGEKTEQGEESTARRAIETGRRVTEATTTSDGRIWDCAAEPVFDPGGEVIGAVIVAHDVTERRRAQARLRESEQRLKTIFRSAPVSIFIKDSSLKYTLVNPAMENLLQMPADRIVGRTDDDLFGYEAGAYLRDVDARVLRGETVEQEHTRPVNGTPLTFLDIRVPMRNEAGEVFEICGIAGNISDRRGPAAPSRAKESEYPSQAMRTTMELARLAAGADSTVLLTGESGSGKDYLSSFIHANSKRSGGPFFAVNCAALPSELAESELFGHEAGAFTGAARRKKGLVEVAEGGTLLLNEIGELTTSLQAKLLTFLDTKTFNRVGGSATISVDVRIIAATNRNLEDEVHNGRFRKDLYYRLNVVNIHVPPLRERVEDLPILAEQILHRLCREMQTPVERTISPEALERMKRYSWPGNVRELRNVLERELILSEGGPLRFESLEPGEARPESWRMWVDFPADRSINDTLAEVKQTLIEEALRRAGGKRQKAADLLGISRFALSRQLRNLDLQEE